MERLTTFSNLSLKPPEHKCIRLRLSKRKMKNNIIVDATFDLEEVLKLRQDLPAPQEVLDRQKIVEVFYYSFDGNLHQGQMVIDTGLVEDIKGIFDLIRKIKFPVYSVIPMIDRRFMLDDERSISLNNSSGFNYRMIVGTNKLSNHATGRAFDINPMQNPYIRSDYRYPPGIDYDPKLPGAIISGGEIAQYLKEKKWEWGGDWTDRKDYMHFQKPL